MGVESEEATAPETGRSKRQSSLEAELKQVLADRGSSLGDDELRNASFDIFYDESELPVFQPRWVVLKRQCDKGLVALDSVASGRLCADSQLLSSRCWL